MGKVIGVLALLAVVAGLIFVGYQVYQEYDRIYQWKEDCHNAGKIVVGENPWYCMTWDQAKEYGVEFEVD